MVEFANRQLLDNWDVRLAVPSPIANVFPIVAQEAPAARRLAIASTSTSFRGLPKRLPLAFAAASPDRTRSRISSRSNWTIDAKRNRELKKWLERQASRICIRQKPHAGAPRKQLLPSPFRRFGTSQNHHFSADIPSVRVDTKSKRGQFEGRALPVSDAVST